MKGLVLVTGATGFVGRALVCALSARGWRVVAAARNPGAVQWPDGVARRYLADLAQPIEWAPLLERVTHVVHLAGIAHASAKLPPSLYTAVNTDAAAELAKAARSTGVRRLVLLSSVRAQSGPSAPAALTENAEARPTDAYGRSKLAAEHAVAEALAGCETEWVVLRPALIYGPGAKGNMGTLARLARLPLPLPFADLGGRRSLLSQANLAAAVDHTLTAPQAAGRTFLVADPEPATVPEIISALRAGLGRGPGLFALPDSWLAAAARLAGRGDAWERLDGDLVVDASALTASGWQPVESTRDALAATASGRDQ
jgi:UDP-glucose 4-epimerase